MSHPFKNKVKDSREVTFSRDMAVIKKQLKSAFSYSYLPSGRRAAKLRSSALPYCPLQDLYNHLTHEIGGFEESYQSLAYTTIGTVIHSLLQNWLPRHADAVEIIGMWGVDVDLPCASENRKGKLVPAKKCPMRDKDGVPTVVGLDAMGCPKCGKVPHYDEVESESTFTSHTDWLWLIKGTNRVYVLDIKTSSLRNVYNHRRNDGSSKYPQYNYVAQIDSYIVQLEERVKAMGYEIWGSVLVYIPRDKPDDFELVTVQRLPTPEWIADKRALLDKVSDGYVKVSELLAPSTLVKLDEATIEEVAAHKLCVSKKDYTSYYDPRLAYKGNDPCPLLNVCFKRKKLLKAFNEAIKDRKSIQANKKKRK